MVGVRGFGLESLTKLTMAIMCKLKRSHWKFTFCVVFFGASQNVAKKIPFAQLKKDETG